MAVISGFFNSIDDDRKYDADDVNRFFESVVAPGVLSAYADGVFVVKDLLDMVITVDPGKAWFNNSWITNTTLKTLTIDESNISYARIDVIVLEFNKTDAVRDNSIEIVKGTAAETPNVPALREDLDSEHIQIPLAHISVGAGVTEINQGNITSKIGGTKCPFATGLIDQLAIPDLMLQWEYEFDAWMAANEAQFNAWMVGLEETLAAIETGEIFEELDEIRNMPHPHTGRNIIINGDFLVDQKASLNYSEVTDFIGDEGGGIVYPGVADRWSFESNGDIGKWTLSKGMNWFDENYYEIKCTEVGTTPIAEWTRFIFKQVIEANRLKDLYKGMATKARHVTLSWSMKSNVTGTYVV